MGLTHLDAGVIIAFLDGSDVHHDAARSALSTALDNAERLSIAASALAECLITTDRKWPTAKAMKLTVSIEQI